jgi:hypothetical protein
MTQTITRLHVHPIEASRLAAMRSNGSDEHGNPFTTYSADGGEPLRCCLDLAEPGEGIALISYAPFERPSPWTEVGPVFVHGAACPGYPSGAGLPPALRTGPSVLRTYAADDTLDYDHITIVGPGEDIEAALDAIFQVAEVATVHVRSLGPQCFTYAVTR